MSYAYDFAARMRKMVQKNEFEANWYAATCISKIPLSFSIIDGNLTFKSGEGLTMTQTASNRNWNVGDAAAAVLSGEGLLVIDAI